ncbi:MAG: hypothetical protein ACRDOP_17230 [Gaiellaceae bacterium]
MAPLGYASQLRPVEVLGTGSLDREPGDARSIEVLELLGELPDGLEVRERGQPA